jgi:hypothetical protein
VGVRMGWLSSRRDQDGGSGTAIVQGCRVEPKHNTMRARAMTRRHEHKRDRTTEAGGDLVGRWNTRLRRTPRRLEVAAVASAWLRMTRPTAHTHTAAGARPRQDQRRRAAPSRRASCQRHRSAATRAQHQ